MRCPSARACSPRMLHGLSLRCGAFSTGLSARLGLWFGDICTYSTSSSWLSASVWPQQLWTTLASPSFLSGPEHQCCQSSPESRLACISTCCLGWTTTGMTMTSTRAFHASCAFRSCCSNWRLTGESGFRLKRAGTGRLQKLQVVLALGYSPQDAQGQ